MRIVELIGSTPSSDNRYFLHRDNQSSIVAITKADVSGAVVEKRYFDAWGNLKSAIVGNTSQVPNSLGWVNGLLIDRGYTGHEHLKTVGLIHMNGRLYDPQLRRFLSPDNYVQDPHNTQNYNRYGYVYNNPLLYSDPSGEIAFLAVIGIAMAVGILTNGINNMINGVPFWYGMGKSGTMGAISGAISFGVGAVANSAFGVLTSVNKALFQAAMHGATGGLMSEIQGGTFASGFAAGAVSSMVSSGVESLGQNGGVGCVNGNDVALMNNFGSSGAYKAVMVASGGLSGGLSSTIAGGKFVDGFRQGVITAGLNHLSNDILENILKGEIQENIKKLEKNYPNKTKYPDAESLYNLIGGKMDKMYDSDVAAGNATYINTCAVRISRALNYSDMEIPSKAGDGIRTFKGGDNKNYIISAIEMVEYLTKKYGSQPFYSTSTKPLNGIIAMFPKNIEGSNVYHVDLVVKGKWIGSPGMIPTYFKIWF
jgi:RHS repeat-associated protein